MIEIELPDGNIAKFEDSTSDEILHRFAQDYIAKTNKSPTSTNEAITQNTDQFGKPLPFSTEANKQLFNQAKGIPQGLGNSFIGAIQTLSSLFNPSSKTGFTKNLTDQVTALKQRQAQLSSDEQSGIKIGQILPALATGNSMGLFRGAALSGAVSGATTLLEEGDLKNRATEIGKESVISTAGAGILKGIANLKSLLQKVTKVNPETVQTFKEANIAPTLGQASDSGIIQRGEAALERLPGAAGQLQKAKETTLNQIKQGIQNIIPSQALTEQGGGELIQQGAKNYVQRFKNTANKLYNRLDKFVPSTEPVKTANTQKTIEKIISELPSGREARQDALSSSSFNMIDKLVKDLEEANGSPDYNTIKYFRSRIGDLIDYKLPAGNKNNADLKQLYGALSDDMKEVFNNKGNKAKSAFEAANNFYQKGKTQIEDKLTRLINNQYPERILSEALSTSTKGGTKIRSILRSLEPDEREILKSTVVERMGQNKEKEFAPTLFLKNYKALSPEARDILFRPNEQMAFTKFNKIIERVRGIENKANTSNTATQLVLTGAGLGLLGLPGAAKVAGGSYLGGKLFTNPKFVNWLGQGEKITGEKEINNHFRKLALIAASNPDIREEIINLLENQ